MPTVDLACARETVEAVLVVLAERRRQDERWGLVAKRGHGLITWLTILAEEIGELALEIEPVSCSEHWHKMREYLVRAEEYARLALEDPAGEPRAVRRRTFRKELVQVAAVALAMLEALDGGTPAGRES